MKERLKRVLSWLAPIEVWQQLRWEAKLRARTGVATLRRRQRARLREVKKDRANDLLVNLGCGPLPRAGWLNVDGVSPQADLLLRLGEPLPLPDGCAAAVFSEHVLEHLEFPKATRVFLSECWRILRCGGRLRLVLPDAGKAMHLYAAGAEGDLQAMSDRTASPIEIVNRLFREEGFHRWAWDYALAERELRLVGFASVRRAQFRDSEMAALNIDHDGPGRVCQSLYIEAVR